MFLNRLKKHKLVFFGLIIFTYYSSFLLVTYHNASKFQSVINRSLIYNDSDWVINQNVLQYSSIVVELDDNHHVQIESIFFYNDENNKKIQLNENLRCLMKGDGMFKPLKVKSIVKIPLMNISDTAKSILKVTCLADKKDYKIDKIRVAIVDFDKYEFPTSLIKYQIPTRFKKIKKIPEIANCIHLVHDLSSRNKLARLFEWIDIQSRFGLNTIKLYLHHVEYGIKERIKEKYPFVKIVDYNTEFNHVCDYELEGIL